MTSLPVWINFGGIVSCHGTLVKSFLNLAVPDHFGNLVFYGGAKVGLQRIGEVLLTVSPEPYEYLLHHVFACVAVFQQDVGRILEDGKIEVVDLFERRMFAFPQSVKQFFIIQRFQGIQLLFAKTSLRLSNCKIKSYRELTVV